MKTYDERGVRVETDYRNYDRLFVTVKLNKFDDLERCYRALGWECADSREDAVRRGRVHLTYRRPHKIENKDKLQLLQVYLESAMNEEGRLDTRSMPFTTAAGIITGLFTVALLAVGLCLMFLLDNPVIYTAGILFSACSVAMLLLAVTITLKVFFNEREKRRARLLVARAEIAAVLDEAAKISGAFFAAGEIEEAAVTSEDCGER